MKSSRATRVRKNQAFSLGALFLAVGVLLTHLGGAWHLATQEHVRCVEHGEWIDAPAHETQANTTPKSQGPIVEGTTSGLASDDHCLIFLASRVRGILWQAVTNVSHASPAIAKAWTPIAAPIETGFAIYLLAPKQSPPC